MVSFCRGWLLGALLTLLSRPSIAKPFFPLFPSRNPQGPPSNNNPSFPTHPFPQTSTTSLVNPPSSTTSLVNHPTPTSPTPSGLGSPPSPPVPSGNQPSHSYCQAPLPLAKTYTPLQPVARRAGPSLKQVHLFISNGDRSPLQYIPRNHLESSVDWECTGPTQGLSIIPDANGDTVTQQVFVNPLPNVAYDPYDELVWNGTCGLGQLTVVGAQQHQQLGQALRKIYVDNLSFLPEIMDSSAIQVRSADIWRTKESVKNMFSTLYPSMMRRNNAQLTMNVYPSKVENLFPRKDCPAESAAQNAIEASAQFKKAIAALSPVLEKLELIFGTQNTARNIKMLNMYYDTIQSRWCHGMPLPSFNGVSLSSSDIEAIQSFGDFETSYLFQSGGDAAKRYQSVGVSNLMNEVFSRLQNPTPKQKMFVYSGVDSTISMLLGAFNSKNISWTPYASSLMIELWKDPFQESYIRVVYNGQTLETADGWCNFEECTLEAFTNYLEPTLQMNLSSLCS